MSSNGTARQWDPKKRQFFQAFEESDDVYYIVDENLYGSAHTENPPLRGEESARDNEGTQYNPLALQSSGDEQHSLDSITRCFGALYDVAIRFRQKTAVQLSELNTVRTTTDEPTFFLLQVVLKDDRGELQTDTGSCVAMLNSGIFNNLRSVAALISLRLECSVSLQSLKAGGANLESIGLGFVCKVALNIYGAQADSHDVANSLSRHNLFLQDPECCQAGIFYENPQYLVLPEEAFSVHADDYHDECLGQVEENANEHLNNIQSSSIVQELMTDTELNLDLLVEQFAQHDYLSQACVDSRIIKTPLLAHQKEGLDFLCRREELVTRQSRSLWQLEDGNNPTSKIYQHRIAGVKSLTADDSRGGILADDMGLGKSLMMISAIVASMEAAQAFALRFTTLPGPGAEATIAAKTTLVVVPSALLIDSWVEEISKHTYWNTLKYYRYHGHKRHIPLYELLQHDVILTTYGTMAIEHKHKKGVLFRVRWYRTVLDEAHVIRNSATAQFRAVSSIKSHIRWCLTGTPIQNSLDDLGSLVTFLNVPILKEAAQFGRFISRRPNKSMESRQLDFRHLRLLLGSICLRRNKNIMPFSQPLEQVSRIYLSTDERQAYNRHSDQWKLAINMAVSGHNSKATHQTVLEAILRMRMFCNHGDYYNDTQNSSIGEAEEMGSILQQKGEATCYYCSCDVLSFSNVAGTGAGTVTFCRHIICDECFEQYEIKAECQRECPICKAQHTMSTKTTSLSTPSAHSRSRDYPTKVKALCINIQQHVHESKSIVFSFWRKSLDLVGLALEEQGTSYLRVDGAISLGRRKRILERFQAAEQGMVLLMTLGTGSVGLNNLCIANHVHILEPQWNPSVESQAIGRAIRLGQTQKVHVTRYIVQSSIEKNVQNGQLRKLQLATGGFGAGMSMSAKHKIQLVKDLIGPQPSD